MQDSLKLGSLGGVKVGVNWSLFALGCAWSPTSWPLPACLQTSPAIHSSAYWVAGTLTAVALFAGVLVHEAAHAVAARRAKMRGRRHHVVVHGRRHPDRGREPQARRPSCGSPWSGRWPAALSGASRWLCRSSPRTLGGVWRRAHCAGSGAINLLLGAFNLVPASPLDGGRVLHGLLWWVTKNRWLATRLAAGAGTVLGAACAFIGLLAFEERDAVDGIVLVLMGWFVHLGVQAGAARRASPARARRRPHLRRHEAGCDRPWLADRQRVLERVGQPLTPRPASCSNAGAGRVVGRGHRPTTSGGTARACSWSVRAQDVAVPLAPPAPEGRSR